MSQRKLDIDGLSDQFALNGYPGLGASSTSVGLSVTTISHRLRLGLEGEYGVVNPSATIPDGPTATIWHGSVSLLAGYNALEWDTFAIYPRVGLGVGKLGVDLDLSRPPMLRDRLNNYRGNTELNRTFGLWEAGLGMSLLIPWESRHKPGEFSTLTREGIDLSLVLGYQGTWVSSEWSGIGNDLGDQPDAQLAGPFVALTVGIGTRQSVGSCHHCPSVPNATVTCSASHCGFTCVDGFGDCDGRKENGCEVPLTSLEHCGECGETCAVDHGAATCSAGWCEVAACDPGYANCDGFPMNGCEQRRTGESVCE